MKILPANISGKSLIFNVLFIAINLIGLTFLLFGYHDAFTEHAFWLKLVGYLVFAAGLLGIAIFQGWMIFSYFSRVFVGGLFIVSGLIKANDPKGFAYKLEEYFEDGALAYRVKDLFGWESFSLEFLIDHALWISVVICIFEIILGVLAIIGAKIRPTAWLMLLMMIFFTLLTWHTSQCDPQATFKDVDEFGINESIAQIKIQEAPSNENITILSQTEKTVTVEEIKKPQCVEDCGCFGDAMKGSVGRSLTASESFWKDIILTYLVLIIFIARRKTKPNSTVENIVMILSSLAFIGFFSWLFTWSFPIFFGLASILIALWIKRAGGKVLGNDFGAIFMITFMSVLFVIYVLMYLPIRDYRPYAVGSNLIEKMNDGIDGEYETQFLYTNASTGQDTLLAALDESTSEIWKNKDTWKWKETIQKTIKAARLPSITEQFNPKVDIANMTEVERKFPAVEALLEENMFPYVDVVEKSSGNRYPQLLEEFYADDWDTSSYFIGDTIVRLDESLSEVSLLNYILEQEQVILVFSRDIEKGHFSRIQRLLDIHTNAKENGIPMFLVSTATADKVKAFREESGLEIPNLINDETELKAITRSNPTLMVIHKAVVVGKYPFRSTPSWDWLVKNEKIKL